MNGAVRDARRLHLGADGRRHGRASGLNSRSTSGRRKSRACSSRPGSSARRSIRSSSGTRRRRRRPADDGPGEWRHGPERPAAVGQRPGRAGDDGQRSDERGDGPAPGDDLRAVRRRPRWLLSRSTASSRRSTPTPTAAASSSSPTPRTPTWRSASVRPASRPRPTRARSAMRTLEEYRELIRQNTRQGLVDIMLMSASTNYQLTIQRAAVRRLARHPGDPRQRHDRRSPRPRLALRRGPGAAAPFGPARSRHVRARRLRPGGADARRRPRPLQRHVQQRPGARPADARTFHQFREEAERKGFRYFLEVFDPNVPGAVDPRGRCPATSTT